MPTSPSIVITIHCVNALSVVLTVYYLILINVQSLALMKASAFLINTSRGGLVDEAALDVLNIEPPNVDNPLFKLDNCIITPHIAWATKTARQRLLNIAAANIEGFLTGDLLCKL